MRPAFTVSQTSTSLRGRAIAGAEDRQRMIPDSTRSAQQQPILCIGAGGIVSQIAPTLARKGVGELVLLDDDLVEASNLNRQRFYEKDIGRNKARALLRTYNMSASPKR